MAYMRGDHYVWSDGDNMHIDSAHLPMDTFDELVAMRWHRMGANEQALAVERAYENHGGNLGCDGVARVLGRPTVKDLMLSRLADEGIELEADG